MYETKDGKQVKNIAKDNGDEEEKEKREKRKSVLIQNQWQEIADKPYR